MLSKEALWCLNVSFRNSRLFNTLPFVWDKKTRIVSVRKRLWIWRIIALILYVYFLFAFGRLIQSYFFLNYPLHKCIVQVYFVISSFYFGTAQLAYWSNYNNFAAFWTQFLEFDRTFSHEKYNGVEKDRIGLMLKILTFLNYNHMIFQGAGFLFIRKSPNFIYSLIYEIWGVDNIYLWIIFATFEVFIMFYSWCGCQLINAGILLFPNSVQRWNEYLVMNADKSWKHQKAKYYRCIQLLISSFSSSHSPIALPAQEFAVLFGGIICTYATIKFYGRVPLFIYLTMPTSVAIMIFYEKFFHGGSSNINISSETLLQNYEGFLLTDINEQLTQQFGNNKPLAIAGCSNGSSSLELEQERSNNNELQQRNYLRKLQKRLLWSFSPLGISVLSFYQIKRGTIMTFGSLVLGNAINLLLA